ncbi:NADP-specific glutamate dehydrogenase [Virgibacillus sp. W0181]|uniref:NADP-specific glutamate dehydrogenase n=1 Tax=Virgibacillus sp. W0181 TaxID=3391581 RepID=UPI003F467F05
MPTKTKKNHTEQEKVEKYLDYILTIVKRRNPHEKEFLQAVKMFLHSLTSVFIKNPKYMEHNILERMVEPERVITFQVPWVDDHGKMQVNRGYRVQFNSAIGPYKGGLRFHPSVSTSIVKFLGFEQIFKNSLTGQPIGGGKGGADFNPKGKSNNEIMRFCQSFMTELAKYIGPDIDIPAGDIGVGKRELGYLFGQYKRISGQYHAGVLTGKGLSYGGSLGRTEATGYGTIYFVDEMLKDADLSLEDSTVVVSGSGNVSIYAMEKAISLGANVVACSDSDGYIYDENGINVETVKKVKEQNSDRIHAYLKEHQDAKYFSDCSGIWSIPCDVALPCATQNEIDRVEANQLLVNGVKAVAEGANMPCTSEAIRVFQTHDILFAPAKAVNAGGVAASALEMAQNSSRISWSFEEVDTMLQEIMKNIYTNCVQAAENYNHSGNLVIGADIAGFTKVADTMIEHGA